MGKKILLADDSITIQKVIELTFSDEDFEVVTVGNGRLAIERLPEARPDLVLCDIIMPEKDGYEVCDFIKKDPSLSHIPVLLLTGAFEPFDQERAVRVGCDGFLAKPFEPQTLIAKVKELLAKKPAVAPPPAAPPAYDRGTGFDQPKPAGPVPVPAPPAMPWGSALPTPPAPAVVPPAPPAAEPAHPPEEPLASDATGASDDDLATVKSPPYQGGEPDRFASRAPASLDELYDEDPYGAPADLMPLTDDESASVTGPREEPAEEEPPAPWAQPTVEVPLETRARAGVESAQMAAEGGGFEEVFDDEAAAAPAPAPAAVERGFGFVRQEDVAGSPAAPSVPSPAAPPTVKEGFGWVRDSDVPAPAAPTAAASVPAAPESSFGDLAGAGEEAGEAAPSVTGEVAVPVDMVEKIAQRVVAQISEKVIREIAWEVIPDLAEALIRKEIERLKAELQQT